MVSQDVRPSVRLTHAGILLKRFNISSNFFISGRHTILVFAVPNIVAIYQPGPLTRELKAIAISTNISLYLRNHTRIRPVTIDDRTQAF